MKQKKKIDKSKLLQGDPREWNQMLVNQAITMVAQWYTRRFVKKEILND